MPAILLTILALLAVNPLASARSEAARQRVQEVYAAIDAATENPDWRAELRRLCKRESWCNRFGVVGLHECDAQERRGRNFWGGSVRRGKLRPETCAAHEMGDPVRWNTTGAFGQAATGVWMLDECVAPEAMYEPAVAAEVAVKTFERMCERGWCSCTDHARVWAGVGRWRSWPFLRRLKSELGLCGARPAWQWLGGAVYDMFVWTPWQMAKGLSALAGSPA
jgi:hypothetical protein